MSADVLRRAAALMRKRAEAATQDPEMWQHEGGGHMDGLIYDDGVYGPFHHEADAEHVASWHPAVALAVADWLDVGADVIDVAPDWFRESALAVARAYLGDP